MNLVFKVWEKSIVGGKARNPGSYPFGESAPPLEPRIRWKLKMNL